MDGCDRMSNNINFIEIYKKSYIDKLDIPDLITEEWLLNQLNSNSYFSIYGFSNIDLSNKIFDKNISREVLRKITFNSNTVLGEDSQIKYDESMLGVDDEIKKLHNIGLSGKGINIAVIDQHMLSMHNEIKDSLVGVNNNSINEKKGMHGTVVTGLLTGKTTGIAPNAKLYYFQIDSNPVNNYIDGVTKSLEDIYRMNEQGENIRIVNVSGPIVNDINGLFHPRVLELINKLKSQGCYVIDSNVFNKSGFTCIDKDYQNNEYFYSDWQEKYKEEYKKRIAIPTGGKLFPSPFSENDYWYKANSTYSWAIPKLCGLFALCLEVNPKLTYEEFVNFSNETKTTNDNGITVINTVGIIDLVKDINKTL